MKIRQLITKTNEALAGKKGFNFGVGKPETADLWGVGDVPAWIPSGITLLDRRLGGGLPLGRISELFSESESEGKTTLALHFAAQVQKVGGVVVWLESEAALDKPRAERLGVDLSALLLWSPSCVEDAFTYIDQVVRNISEDDELKGVPTLIVWDTIAAAPTRAEKEGDAFADGIGVKNRIISAALRRYVQEFFKYKVHLLLVNQSYTLLNRANPYAPQFETPGGKAIKFACTTRIRCKRSGYVGESRDLGPGDSRTGISVKITAVKNKLALPFQESELVLFGERGYNDVMSMAHFLLDNKVSEAISGKGWYTLPGGVKTQWSGLEEAVSSSPEILRVWRDKVAEIVPLPLDREVGQKGWVVRKSGVPLEVQPETEGEEDGEPEEAPRRKRT